jgi:Zn-finger nucleic acid-binding protein
MCHNRRVTCPNCLSDMQELTVEETYGRRLVLDICRDCHGLWFDGSELLQLSPASTIELFKTLTDEASSPQPHGSTLACPRCGQQLLPASDLQRNTRLHYARCPAGHGRFLTFFQFLRAKNFVRTLSPTELRALREHIRQINCSNCGAAVDVEHAAACRYCRTPVSIIDPGQVKSTLEELDQAVARRQAVDPTLPVRLMQERLRAEQAFAPMEPGWALALLHKDRSGDLVQAGVRALMSLLAR